MCRYRYEDGASAPVFRNQFIFRKFLFYSFNVCTWFINLVDCNNDFYTCCFCMADSLNSLWHDTIISRDNEYCNISRVCTTHTHCCECFMSRCIKESDLLSVDFNNRGTDVLCDSTCLASCYMCITNCIQKGCLTMVNMTHNADNRRSGNHCRFVFLFFFQKFFDNIYFFFRFCNDIVVKCDFLCFFEIDLMVYSYHDTFHKELLNNYRRLHLHCFCKLADCHFLRKSDLFYFWFLLFLFWLRSRFLKSFRNSGKISSSALIRSVVTCTGIFLKIFLFVLILSVTLSLAVLGCFCQFWCEYGIIISSSAAGSLSATVISAKASFTSVVRSSVSALSWSSLTTLLRTAITSHWTAIAFTLTCRTAFSLSLRTATTVTVALRSTVRWSFVSIVSEITVSSVITAVISTILTIISVRAVLVSVVIIATLLASLRSCLSLSCFCCRFLSRFLSCRCFLHRSTLRFLRCSSFCCRFLSYCLSRFCCLCSLLRSCRRFFI